MNGKVSAPIQEPDSPSHADSVVRWAWKRGFDADLLKDLGKQAKLLAEGDRANRLGARCDYTTVPQVQISKSKDSAFRLTGDSIPVVNIYHTFEEEGFAGVALTQEYSDGESDGESVPSDLYLIVEDTERNRTLINEACEKVGVKVIEPGQLYLPAARITRETLPQDGRWSFFDVPGEVVLADIELLLTEYGKALGAPQGTNLRDYALQCLFLHLKDTDSCYLFAADDSGGIIKNLCGALAVFSARLVIEAEEHDGKLNNGESIEQEEGRRPGRPPGSTVRVQKWEQAFGEVVVEFKKANNGKLPTNLEICQRFDKRNRECKSYNELIEPPKKCKTWYECYNNDPQYIHDRFGPFWKKFDGTTIE